MVIFVSDNNKINDKIIKCKIIYNNKYSPIENNAFMIFFFNK